MELILTIMTGARKGQVITLQKRSEAKNADIPWVLEDEEIKFDITVPRLYRSSILELYQHSIPTSHASYPPEHPDSVKFSWIPDTNSNITASKLFWNYFGVAELNLLLNDENGETSELLNFQPIQVVATKSSADKVERMFEYLASISSEALHSVFSATRHTVGFEEGAVSPSYTFERLEHAIAALRELLPHVLRSPLTRLVPEQKLVPLTGREELDDSSIGWLVENLSVLQPTDHPEDAHVYYDGDHFKASGLLLPVLEEQTDIYENRVIHGFIDLLIRTAQNLGNRMESELTRHGSNSTIPNGYVSFFEKVTRFKAQLMGTQINKIDAILSTLNQYKIVVDRQLFVKHPIHERPIITPKTQCKPAYRDLFVEIIKWHEKGKIDWTAYENLFAIESIPMLFEAYCYFRVLEVTNKFLHTPTHESVKTKERTLKTSFTDKGNNEIEVIKEPEYWTLNHNNRHPEYIVNGEAFTVNKDNRSIRQRSQSGANSKRAPDIVIQIKNPQGKVRLIILDAKYSYANKAFIDYLPDLTMKYVHGIHRFGQNEPLVSSMSILYPDDKAGFRGFHYGPLGVFGEAPVSPSLQACGIVLGNDRQLDQLDRLIRRTLELEGVSPQGLQLIETERDVA
ncbi:DUF2357 domain-containing protein [Pseudomonas aeruginosa]|uniref:DUF2357 domain-containing protein n=1 Tax=Pseudomonas aeruginosa TaxID=287 RepID=UPI003F76CCAE